MAEFCYWCNQETNKIHVDHYFPKRFGGTNNTTNLVRSCPDCNLSKNRNFWFKNEKNEILKFNKPKQFVKIEETTEGHRLAIVTTVYIIKKRYKKIIPKLYRKFGQEI